MATYDQVMTALRNADAAGATDDAKRLAQIAQGMKSQPEPAAKGPDAIPTGGMKAPASDGSVRKEVDPKTFGPIDKFVGVGDGLLSAGSNIAASMVAPVAGLARSVVGGNYGTPKGVQQGDAFAKRIQGGAYQPRTEAGRSFLGSISDGFEKSKLAIPMIPEIPRLSPLSNPSALQAGEAGANAASRVADKFAKPQKPMIGVGAAETQAALRRQVEANSLPVPIALTKGQKSRDFEQLRFEKETAKNGNVGEPLRNRYADQNERLIKNIDAFGQQTGAQASGLRSVGENVVNALEGKNTQVSGRISAAYKKAKQAGQMEDPVSVKSITDFIEQNRSVMRNAPVLRTVQDEVKRLTKGKRDTLTVFEMEELRKTINSAADMTGPDANFAPKIKGLIDSATEGKGGDLYRQARRLAENHFKQFEDRAVVKKLMSSKKGDRSVAFEDVFQHSILKGSLDDVKHMRRVLQTSGEGGQQAWKELQGQTIQHMKETITAGVDMDSRGNTVISPAKLKKMVTELDADGKLDFIFGKKGAEQIRAVNDIAQEVLTVPKDSVNYSNTASVLAGMLDMGGMAASHYAGHFLPVPVISAGTYGYKSYKNKQLGKRVQDALGPIPAPPGRSP